MPAGNVGMPSSIKNAIQTSRKPSIVSEFNFSNSFCDVNSSSRSSPSRNLVNNNENLHFKLVSNWLRNGEVDDEGVNGDFDVLDPHGSESNDSNNSMSADAEDDGDEEGHDDYEERGGVLALHYGLQNNSFIMLASRLGLPKQQRILIVDDEPFNVLGMQLMLLRLGINGLGNVLDRAYNGLEALNKVRDSFKDGSHVYSLILTDISMPVMDGFDSSQAIRDYYREVQCPQPMIVACTGHIEEEYIKQAWLYEIDEVIPKPVKIELLQEIFNEMI